MTEEEKLEAIEDAHNKARGILVDSIRAIDSNCITAMPKTKEKVQRMLIALNDNEKISKELLKVDSTFALVHAQTIYLMVVHPFSIDDLCNFQQLLMLR